MSSTTSVQISDGYHRNSQNLIFPVLYLLRANYNSATVPKHIWKKLQYEISIIQIEGNTALILWCVHENALCIPVRLVHLYWILIWLHQVRSMSVYSRYSGRNQCVYRLHIRTVSNVQLKSYLVITNCTLH